VSSTNGKWEGGSKKASSMRHACSSRAPAAPLPRRWRRQTSVTVQMSFILLHRFKKSKLTGLLQYRSTVQRTYVVCSYNFLLSQHVKKNNFSLLQLARVHLNSEVSVFISNIRVDISCSGVGENCVYGRPFLVLPVRRAVMWHQYIPHNISMQAMTMLQG
jgi:hypothetical protein